MDEVMQEIEKLRAQINDLDREIVAALNKRAMLVLEIKSAKDQAGIDLLDPKREEQIFDNISSSNDGPLYDDSLKSIYEMILKEMKTLENS